MYRKRKTVQKEETKTNKRQGPLSPVHDPWKQSNGTRKTPEERICETDRVL